MQDKPPVTHGMKAVSLLLVWMSCAQVDFRVPFSLPQTAYNVAVLVTALTGLVAAMAIWMDTNWMVFAYVGWLVLMLVTRLWHDVRLGASIGELVLGGLFVAALLGVVGYFLYREQQSRVGI